MAKGQDQGEFPNIKVGRESGTHRLLVIDLHDHVVEHVNHDVAHKDGEDVVSKLRHAGGPNNGDRNGGYIRHDERQKPGLVVNVPPKEANNLQNN